MAPPRSPAAQVKCSGSQLMAARPGDGPLSAVHLEPPFRPLNIIGQVGGNNLAGLFVRALCGLQIFLRAS